jgi:hypothetical protein
MKEAPGIRAWLEAAIDVSSTAKHPSSDGVDWDALLESSESNRVDSQLYALVRGRDDVPEQVRATLKSRDAVSKLTGLQALAWKLELIDALEAAGIAALAYKGPVLSDRLYGNPGARRFVDLDVIVHREHVPRALDLLAKRGWVPPPPWDRAKLEEALRSDCEISVVHPERHLRLEVHWELLPPQHQLGFTMATLWPRLDRRSVGGRSLRCFAVEDEFLVLCTHAGEKHRWMRLSMASDVARLLASAPDFDWNLARANAAEVQRSETLLFGAAWAALLAGAPVPSDVLSEAATSDVLVTRLALWRARPFREGMGQPSFSEWSENLADLCERFAARGVECPLRPTRSTYAAAILRPDWEDRQAVALPASLRALWWVLRPFRMLKLHGVRLVKRM